MLRPVGLVLLYYHAGVFDIVLLVQDEVAYLVDDGKVQRQRDHHYHDEEKIFPPVSLQ